MALNTSDLSEGRHLWARELAKFDDILSAATLSRSPCEVLKPSKREPSIMEVEEGVRQWFAERLERVQREGDGAVDPNAATARLADYEALEQDVSAGVKLGSDAALTTTWAADALIDRNGWSVSDGTPMHRRLVRLVGRGQIEAANRLRQELSGEPTRIMDDTFAPEQFRLDEERRRSRPTGDPVSVTALFEGYIAERKPADATVKAWRRQLAALVSFLGYDDASRITHSDVVRWKDYLLTRPGKTGKGLSAKTVSETYLSAAKTIFRWAVDNGRLSHNPASKVRVLGPKRVYNRERGLNDGEAKTILSATLLPAPARLSPERVFARRWVPWICAYTGARVNEITQLRSQDVAKIEGIWTIRITPEAGPIKNFARTVALHPHLVEQGFPAIAAKAKGYLFFDPTRHRGGSAGNPQSKKVGEHLAKWVRDLGVSHPDVQPNHGWRHRFKTLARRHRMDPEIREHIQGHVPRTEGERYGDMPINASLREIELLPRYDLSDGQGYSGVSMPT